MERSARILFDEPGVEPRLPLSLQLVREAALRVEATAFRSPQQSRAKWRCVKNDCGADHLWFADDIFALSPQWTREFADAVEQRRRTIAVQHAIALRPDDSRHGRGARRSWLRRSLDGRRIRLAENSGRHGQGHARGADSRSARKSAPARHSRLLFPAVRISGRDMGRTSKTPSAWFARRSRTISAFRSPIRCPERASTRAWQTGSATKPTGAIVTTLAMMFHGSFRRSFIARSPTPCTRKFAERDPLWDRVLRARTSVLENGAGWTCC